MIALEKFNKPDFEFADNIVPFYVNPVDTKEKMEKYRSRTEIPFKILVEAKEVRMAYGVRGYPTFYLIDDKGTIEEVFEGFGDELIRKIKKGGVSGQIVFYLLPEMQKPSRISK